MADPVTGKEQQELSGRAGSRVRLGLDEEEGEMDSDISGARRSTGNGRLGERKERVKFHSLLSVVGGEGVDSEDGDWEEEEEEEEEGGRKGLFDSRR